MAGHASGWRRSPRHKLSVVPDKHSFRQRVALSGAERRSGTHTPRKQCDEDSWWYCDRLQSKDHAVWVPAFAGTTAEKAAARPKSSGLSPSPADTLPDTASWSHPRRLPAAAVAG